MYIKIEQELLKYSFSRARTHSLWSGFCSFPNASQIISTPEETLKIIWKG